jgi:uncharacterized protein
LAKPVKRAEHLEVVYDSERWRLLREARTKALRVMETLKTCNFDSIVHGSTARGDVSATSDVDIFVPSIGSSFSLEIALERAGFQAGQRTILQATPLYAMKGYIELDAQTSISFPLVKMRPVEKEFYKFGGQATAHDLLNEKRIPGVDKRLMLIEPTPNGHVETTIVGQEEATARILGVSLNTVLDRVRALLRRDKIGRTGVFIEKVLVPDETFEQAMKKVADKNPAVRRRTKFYQK